MVLYVWGVRFEGERESEREESERVYAREKEGGERERARGESGRYRPSSSERVASVSLRWGLGLTRVPRS